MLELEKSRCRGLRGFVMPLALALLLGSGVPEMASAEETSWSIYAGRFGVGKKGDVSELGFEVRRPLGATSLDLVGGVAGTEEEAAWVYLGASRGYALADRWELRPGFAVSYFDEGDGKDLGGPIEFRSSIELAYGVSDDLSVGLLFYHLSNAGIYDLNPGANSVVVTVGFH